MIRSTSGTLYASRMGRACAAGIALLLAVGAAAHVAADRAEDRLTRFSELGRLLSGSNEAEGPVDSDAALAELFALADAEIVENLRAGEPYASAPFIQERLDAFMAAWGGARLRIHRLGRTGEATPLTIGVFAVPASAAPGSVRVYGSRVGGEVTLLVASTHDGVPELHAWPPARDGASQFMVTWLGAASGLGGRPLVVELWRRSRREGAERIWNSATVFADGLSALGLGVRNGAMAIRYEARYPGWKP